MIGRSRGQSSSEYLLITALVAIAMALGSPSPLARLLDAVSSQYARFTYAISLP